MSWAARLIEQHFDEFFYLRSEGVTVRRWLRRSRPSWPTRGHACCWPGQPWPCSAATRRRPFLLDAAEAARAVVQLVLFPLVFLSGSYMPIHSDMLNRISGALPVRPFNQALIGPFA